jgi:uridine kinase
LSSVIIDGILIFVEKKLGELMDIKTFVDTADDVRLIRRIKRDMSERCRTLESILWQYLETVRPIHIKFVEPSKQYADFIVAGEDNHLAAGKILSKIRLKTVCHRAL